MDKSVLISIRPKWCELIANGKKTVEVRKTRPAIKTPFKCYIYCTLQGSNELFKHTFNGSMAKWNEGKWGLKKGSVIGEFICNLIAPIAYTTDGFADIVDCETTCMTPQNFLDYGKGAVLYGWRISDLVIYDKPHDLSELRTICRHYDDGLCGDCEYYDYANNESYHYEECMVDGLKPITRPPQSWCYVEEAK